MRRRVDHQRKALLGRGELRDVVLGVGAADMLLHGAISLLLQLRALAGVVWDMVREGIDVALELEL